MVTRVEPARVRVVRDREAFLEGDVIYVLDGLGEGRHRVWHYGRVRVADVSGLALHPDATCGTVGVPCWGEAEMPLRETWWGWVRRPDGTLGWVRQPTEGFADVLHGR